MMPWLALNSAILGASASIQQAASIIRNVRIPLSIIPMKAVVRAYYEHLWTMAILLIALLLGGVPVTWHYLELAYYLAASWVLLIGAALLTSSLTAVFRDFGELLQPLMRLLFYVSSVVWAIDGLSPGLQRVMRLNPLVYIIEGYRKCLLYGEGFWSSPGQGAYFWLAALALLFALVLLYLLAGRLAWRKAGFYGTLAMLLVFVASTSFAVTERRELLDSTEAVVMSSSVSVKSSPDKASTDLFVLHEGTKVRTVSELGDWREIVIADGKKGWVEARTIETI